MKARLLWVLLLSACMDPDAAYDYALTWECRSAEGCERTEEVKVIDRLNTTGDSFFFRSTRDESYFEAAQKFGSESLPAGCSWLYSLTLFGHELESSKFCETSTGFELELSIPNRNPAFHSQWLVEARRL